MSTDKIISNFPLLRFSSLLGVHSILLIFVAFFLPRSSFLLSDLPPQASSRDRPQHEFLRPITAEPQLTLVWLCIGAIIVQASWASRLKYETVSVKLQLFGEDEEARVKRTMESSKERLNSIFDTVRSTFACSIFFHVILILFGAPFTECFFRTYFLALLLSVLSIYPSVYTLGSPDFLSSESRALVHRMHWQRLFAELSSPYERLLVFPAIGSLFGCWIGVFPIALDWDRPWQSWPLTPAYGAIVGNIVGWWSSLTYDTIIFLADVDKASIAEKARAENKSVSSKKKKVGNKQKEAKTF